MQVSESSQQQMTHPPLQGLSTQEVEVRRAAGKGAVMPPPTGRTYAQIIREDVFTLIDRFVVSALHSLADPGTDTLRR